MAKNNEINLRILTHSGGEYNVTADVYDPSELADAINSREQEVIVIGDTVFSCIDVKNITKISEG